jgi:hypothetical protein
MTLKQAQKLARQNGLSIRKRLEGGYVINYAHNPTKESAEYAHTVSGAIKWAKYLAKHIK